MSDVDERERLCRSLGFDSLMKVHEWIVAGVRNGADTLLQRRLNARSLQSLGYSAPGLTKLGYSSDDLQRLGFHVSSAESLSPSKPDPLTLSNGSEAEKNPIANLRSLIAQGQGAAELRPLGVRVHHCKMAGFEVRDLYRIGFTLEELAPEYSPAELRRAGFKGRELSRFFSGAQIRAAGFSASEMRTSGFSIRDLRGFGYSDNHIITAGYSLNELAREGLTKYVKDKSGLSRY